MNHEDLTIVNVGYRSTNYWVISAGRSRLLVDLGWPGSFGLLRSNLERMDIPVEEIHYGLATHYHIDHAGVAQELKLAGVPLLVMDLQVAAIPTMKKWTKPHDNHMDISMEGNTVIPISESRALLAALGISGEIVHTPGHSDDSVSLLLDRGEVFTGDLTHPALVTEEQANLVASSWSTLVDLGALDVYPGHGPIWSLSNGRDIGASVGR